MKGRNIMKRMRKVVITMLLFSISFNFLVENGANAAKKVKLNKTKITLKAVSYTHLTLPTI